MSRIALTLVLLVASSCSGSVDDVDTTVGGHSLFSRSLDGARDTLVVWPAPTVLCWSWDLETDTNTKVKRLELSSERHQVLVDLVDDTFFVSQYRVDASEPGDRERECFGDGSHCYERGFSILPGPDSAIGDAAYVLHISPTTRAEWTAETNALIEAYTLAFEDCVDLGTPFDNPWQ